MKDAVTLYTRAGCHLCDDAKVSLARLGIPWTEIDIDVHPALRSEFGDRVPVIERYGRIIAEGNLEDAPLASLLES